jgi:hypothetical protein
MANSKSRSRPPIDALGLEREIKALRAEIKKLNAGFRKIVVAKRRTKLN